MKRAKKITFFIVFALIAAFAASVVFGFTSQYGDIESVYIKGVNDIRLGIDIQGGVDVTFEPADGVDATDEQLDAALEVVKLRLASLNINDSEVYCDDQNDRIIVRFPWQAGEENFDPEAAVKELGETAVLTFRAGSEKNEDGTPSGDIVLQGNDVKKAEPLRQPNDDGTFSYVVSLELSDSGAEYFSQITSAMAGTGEAISIWMDNNMISAPTVNEAITDGKAVITGTFTKDEATRIANLINSGSLPFSLEAIEHQSIGATLGAEALNTSLFAGVIGVALVFIFMIIFYRVSGVAADWALVIYLSAELIILNGLNITLTLPGIAGIILSVGMAVDANVIIFERIKEELAAGRTLRLALENGFSRAFPAIFDSNITTLIACVVLFWLGTGPIRGFAQTLAIGIVLSMFTALVITRYIIKGLVGAGVKNPKFFGGK